MNDNDIIEALECCVGKSLKRYLCLKCPLRDRDCYGGALLMPAVLELINRQKSEIERLTKENEQAIEKWHILEKRTKERYAELYEEAKEVVRAEAIKEFWERLEKDFPSLFAGQHPCVLSEIDFLVKEMTEGKDGNV